MQRGPGGQRHVGLVESVQHLLPDIGRQQCQPHHRDVRLHQRIGQQLAEQRGQLPAHVIVDRRGGPRDVPGKGRAFAAILHRALEVEVGTPCRRQRDDFMRDPGHADGPDGRLPGKQDLEQRMLVEFPRWRDGLDHARERHVAMAECIEGHASFGLQLLAERPVCPHDIAQDDRIHETADDAGQLRRVAQRHRRADAKVGLARQPREQHAESCQRHHVGRRAGFMGQRAQPIGEIGIQRKADPARDPFACCRPHQRAQ